MPIPLSEIAILIPAYRNNEMTRMAIQIAMQTGVDEVLVSDDFGLLDKAWVLKGLNKKSLKWFSQENGLGLWENHLFLLEKSSKNWIKFLQIDDGFSRDDILQMAKFASNEVSLISTEPYYLYPNGKKVFVNRISVPFFYEKKQFCAEMEIKGNLAGRPSYCLYNKSMMNLDPKLWITGISADLVQNAWLGSQGKVVLLPSNQVYCGIHKDQEGNLQSFELIFRRIYNSSKALVNLNKDTNKIWNSIRAAECIQLLVIWMVCIKRLQPISKIPYLSFLSFLFRNFCNCLFSPSYWLRSVKYLRYKFTQ